MYKTAISVQFSQPYEVADVDKKTFLSFPDAPTSGSFGLEVTKVNRKIRGSANEHIAQTE